MVSQSKGYKLVKNEAGQEPPDEGLLPLGEKDSNGHAFCVAVADTLWGQIPGKAKRGRCWCTYNGLEYSTKNFSYVLSPLSHVRKVEHQHSEDCAGLPPDAIKIGHEKKNGAMYAAIALDVKGRQVLGKASEHTCMYGQDGKEKETPKFSWLVYNADPNNNLSLAGEDNVKEVTIPAAVSTEDDVKKSDSEDETEHVVKNEETIPEAIPVEDDTKKPGSGEDEADCVVVEKETVGEEEPVEEVENIVPVESNVKKSNPLHFLREAVSELEEREKVVSEQWLGQRDSSPGSEVDEDIKHIIEEEKTKEGKDERIDTGVDGLHEEAEEDNKEINNAEAEIIKSDPTENVVEVKREPKEIEDRELDHEDKTVNGIDNDTDQETSTVMTEISDEKVELKSVELSHTVSVDETDSNVQVSLVDKIENENMAVEVGNDPQISDEEDVVPQTVSDGNTNSSVTVTELEERERKWELKEIEIAKGKQVNETGDDDDEGLKYEKMEEEEEAKELAEAMMETDGLDEADEVAYEQEEELEEARELAEAGQIDGGANRKNSSSESQTSSDSDEEIKKQQSSETKDVAENKMKDDTSDSESDGDKEKTDASSLDGTH